MTKYVATGLLIMASLAMASENATVYENGQWKSQPSRELPDVQNFQPAEVKLDQYGGWLERQEKATGFFHTAKIDGRWWLVDPDGNLFLSVGVDSVKMAAGDAKDEDSDDDGEASDDAVERGEQTVSLLRENGFNTLGCWSDTVTVRKLQRPMAYCPRCGFMAAYRQHRKSRHPATGTADVIYPFDPEFESFCDARAAALEKTRNDPWLLGYFSDNELPFHEGGIVKSYLSFPADDPTHQAAANFMASRGHDVPTHADDRAFLELVVSEYYRKVGAAIKKHDPNHLFLGSRFHGLALASPAVFEASGPYTDVVSVNYYHHWTPQNSKIESWATVAGKPVLITEWYAKAADSGLPIQTGAGFAVQTQADRAALYQNFTLTLLQNPACVGWHWFKYKDAGNNAGIVNAKDQPYPLLLNAMRQINTQAYPLTTVLGR